MEVQEHISFFFGLRFFFGVTFTVGLVIYLYDFFTPAKSKAEA